ncbi:hypothetical protein D3C80_1409650 [compost metagenome]
MPCATLVIFRSLPALPTETVLLSVAMEPAPRATAFSAPSTTLAPEPIAVLLVAVAATLAPWPMAEEPVAAAVEPSPIATEPSPLATALPPAATEPTPDAVASAVGIDGLALKYRVPLVLMFSMATLVAFN